MYLISNIVKYCDYVYISYYQTYIMFVKHDKLKTQFFVEGEKQLIKQHVFLEKAVKPSSYSGDDIPQGILLITNKRLFFFYINQGKMKNLILKALPGFLPVIGDGIGGEDMSKIVEFLVEISEEVGESLIEKLKEEKDIIEYLDNKGSFVVPLKRIINYQKTPFYLWFFGGIFALKKTYFRFDLLNNDGTVTNYCIYSQNPKSPFNAFKQVTPFRLNRIMKKANSLKD